MSWNNTVGGKKAELIPCPDSIEGCLVAHYKVIEEPSKELTDEEIMSVANHIFNTYKNWHHYQIDFARAILRKAQEK